MDEKQYLEAVMNLLDDTYIFMTGNSDKAYDNYHSIVIETEHRIKALKAQEDNIKSEMWEEKQS